MTGAGERANTVARIEAGLAEAWRRQCSWIPGGQSAYVDGLLVCRSLLPDPTMSTAVVRREPDDHAVAVDSAASLFSIVGLPLTVDVADGLRPRLEQAMVDRGMGEVARRPGLAVDLDRVELAPSPVDVRIAPVSSPAELAAVREVQTAAFGMPPEVMAGLLHDDVLATSGVYQFGAWAEATLVSCATMHVDDRAAGLFGIATHPDHQRRGVGAAITSAALAGARDLGADLAWLQTTDAGLGVYQSLGLEPIVDFVVWR
ncbi:MAG: GNAT family N-acetyltransferase [Actinomycetia bacterium]|nr:GNAT family N-acetyltransferase [Actinomycetes bacterium]